MRYHLQTVSLLTMHGKERVIAPVLEAGLGCTVAHIDSFDTDSLGSFSRDVARTGSAWQTCRRKAEMGMGLAQTALGVASEGSFTADPWSGLLPWNVETLVFIDATHGWDITGVAQGPAHNHQTRVQTWSELARFAEQHGFPGHQLCLRPHGDHDTRVLKGIASWEDLKQGFGFCLAQSDGQPVHVESELRAFGNPTRMAMIARAAQDLVDKIRHDCPACHKPGYQVTSHLSGLPCAACGSPTRMATHAVWRCAHCEHSHPEPMATTSRADPSRCDRCNP